MVAKVLRTRVNGEQRFVAPVRDDGRSFRYEMVFRGGSRRAYADRLDELVDVLSPGYLALPEDARYKARLRTAVFTQVSLQAAINADFTPLAEYASDEQIHVLTGDRATPPLVEVWDCEVPLVLVDTYYEPRGERPRPTVPEGATGTLIWLNPLTDWDLLTSLHKAGVVGFAESLNVSALEKAGPLVPPQT